jgi:hypothetical protein
MSTVDPDAARRERQARTTTASDLILPALGMLLLPAITTLLIVRMIKASIAMHAPGWNIFLAMTVRTVSAAVVLFCLARWYSVVRRNQRLPGVLVPIALAVLGVGAGFGFSPEPPAWVASFEPRMDALILIAIGVVLLVLSGWTRARRIARNELEAELMRAAPPVPGYVSNQGYDLMDPDAVTLLTTVTFTFLDADGVRRFVQKYQAIPRADPIVNGERVDLWFDRAEPSNTKRIIVRRRAAGQRA